MEEGLRSRVILILIILTTIFFMATVSSCSLARRQKTSRDKEMVMRLELEEKMSRFMQDKANMETRLNNLDSELEKEKSAHQATNKDLQEERLVSKAFKEELEKLIMLKDKLEENLKEALVAGKAGPKK